MEIIVLPDGDLRVVCLSMQGPVENSKPGSDFPMKTAIRFSDQNRIPIDPDQIFNRDRSCDCNVKSGIRFQNKNRDPILRSKSLIDFRTKIGIRFLVPTVVVFLKLAFNRDPISI